MSPQPTPLGAASHGREYVRRGFEESGEFASLLAAITLSGAASVAASSLISARVDPRNQPGNGMLTRDAALSLPLLSLPGRNGLDLGLALSYSSMVWTRSGPYIYFDEDNGFPSPGFRLGFPTVQRKVFDAQTGKQSYLMITADASGTATGRHVEYLRCDGLVLPAPDGQRPGQREPQHVCLSHDAHQRRQLQLVRAVPLRLRRDDAHAVSCSCEPVTGRDSDDDLQQSGPARAHHYDECVPRFITLLLPTRTEERKSDPPLSENVGEVLRQRLVAFRCGN
ncbi:MAG TPA: hypothetical protein VJ784_05385 [Pyrinomonadaceae bacterium]|nr:hypothetical protein [Pyrinomonadaceae bacterium]